MSAEPDFPVARVTGIAAAGPRYPSRVYCARCGLSNSHLRGCKATGIEARAIAPPGPGLHGKRRYPPAIPANPVRIVVHSGVRMVKAGVEWRIDGTDLALEFNEHDDMFDLAGPDGVITICYARTLKEAGKLLARQRPKLAKAS